MSKTKTGITIASAACLALACGSVKKSEGYWPTVKVDTVGTGRPCTGGYGETENVKCGETHDETYWADRLKMRLADEYDREIGKCIHVDLPDSVRAAAISTAYNAGSAAVCRSPMVEKWNAGDFRGGCKALAGWYIRAQGRVLRGLINRRNNDMRLCLSGVDAKPGESLPEKPAPPPEVAQGRPAPVVKPKHVAKPKPSPSGLCWIFKC